MKAATYNPDTLKRIRAGACAADLGWSETFYRDVCRKHGIEAMPSPDISRTLSSLSIASPPTAKPYPAPLCAEPPLAGPKTGHSVAVTADMLCDLKDAADAACTSMASIARKAVMDAVDLGDALPFYRPEKQLNAYLTVTFTVAQFSELEAYVEGIGIKFGVFVRRAVAHALSKRVRK